MMKKKLFFAALSIVWLWPKIAAAQCLTYNGRATVVQVNSLLGPVVLSDTGNLDQTGGAKQASLLNASLPGLLSGEVAHATTVGGGSASRSQASMGGVNVTVAGITIGADFVMARANASCGSPGPTVSGSAEIDGLVVNGLPILVTGTPNQGVSLPGGVQLILNEQTSSVQDQTGSITVNAIHVSVPLVTDAVIASGFALAGGAPSLPRLRPRIGTCPATPTLSSIAPNMAGAGGAGFTLTVNGTGFDPSSSTVQWNGSNLSTTFVSATQVTAAVPASLIASAGTASVTVTITDTCTSQILTSNAVSFTVTQQPQPCQDHVSGGGYRKDNSPKHDFAVAGGYSNGQPWGHMEFHDEDNDRKVHGTDVEDCEEIDNDTREIKGTADVDGQSGDQCGPFKYNVDVTHNDADDSKDTFAMTVFNGCGTVVESEGEPAGSTTLQGGHIDKDD